MSDLKSICALLESRQYALLPTNNLSENHGHDSSSNSVDIDSHSMVNVLVQNDLIQTVCLKLKHENNTNTWSTVLTSYILVKYCYPLLLLFGLSGNALTFLVMCRVHRRKRNFQKFSLSLGTLALADLAILIFGCLVEYLDEVAGIKFKTLSLASCKLTLFACYLFSCYSGYLHAFIAVERWHAISSPLTSITRFTFKTNRLILVIVFLLCILINLPLLWFPAVNQLIQLDSSNSIGVRIVEECQIAQDTILFLIDSLFYCLVPFFLTILFSMLTLVKLIRIRSSTNSTGSETPRPRSPDEVSKVMISGASAAPTNPVCTINGTTATTNTNCNGNYSPTRVHIVHNKGSGASFTSNRLKVYKLTSASINSHSSGKSNVKLTLMLMALPISYLVTTFPIFLIVVHGLLVNNNLLPDHLARPIQTNFQLVYAIAKIFMYVNNSINILFYILFGKNLRKDFVALLTSPLNCFGLMPMKKRFKRSSDHRFHSLTNYDQQDVRFVAQQQANNHHRQSGSLKRFNHQ